MYHRRLGIRAALIVLVVVFAAGATAVRPQALHAQAGGSISYGSKVFGRIFPDTPDVLYSFTGTAGDLVEVHARNWVGTIVPQVTLLAPDGQLAAASEHTPFAVDPQESYLALFLPQTGTYMLRVTAEPGTLGEFVLTLRGRSPIASTPLVYSQGIDVLVPPEPQPQYFTFDTEDCPTTLTVTNLSEGEPFTFPYAVKIRNQQGHQVALLLGGDTIEDRVIVPALSGRYEVEVWSDDPRTTGTVHLLVSCGDQSPGCVTGGTFTPAGTSGEACPPCISEDPGPCAAFEVTVTPQDAGTFRFEWPAVDGAEWYIFQILDAWEHLLEDSARILEGDRSLAYTVRLEEAGRGPFRAIVLAGPAGPAGGYLCTADTTFALEGTEACTALAVAVHAVPGADRAAVVEWTAAPGAGAYLIHIYAYAEGGGLIGIRVLTAPADAATYHLAAEVFPADYDSFQIKVGAYSEATGGGAFGDMPTGFLCSGSADITFESISPLDRGPVEWGPPAGE